MSCAFLLLMFVGCRATESDCEKARDNIIRLTVNGDKTTKGKSEDERKLIEQDVKERVNQSFMENCIGKSKSEVECTIQAKNLEEVKKCTE
jgi:hypothetical protein